MIADSVCHVLWGCSGIRREGIDLSAMIARGDVVIVNADLDLPVETIEDPSEILSETERCRAKEYVRDCDRLRYIRRRMMLRGLLGNILGCDPQSVTIRMNPSGKPFVDPGSAAWPLSFSIAHSRDRVIYAFARGRSVGVDIEYYDSTVKVMKIAGIVCAPGERGRLKALTGDERIRAFYDCWCAKEAFIKAAGVREPTSFEVSFRPEEPGLIGVNRNPVPADHWTFHRLEAGADWAAMLVTEGCPKAIHWLYDPEVGSFSR